MEVKMMNLIILTFTLVCVMADDTVKVHTTTGILHGKRTTTLEKRLIQFLGVPYAKPPVGDLRFKPPVEMASETTAIDAGRYAPSCYQPLHIKSVISPLLKPNQAEISEDCLYLNVFVPEEVRQEGLLPVMVWLPGEGFDYADPQQFDGSYLAVLGKVIVVTVNYRVSVFGFLSTGSQDAPGNAGLLDQRMALKWLKKNIARFGGDSENISMMGRFTGAMSIAIHALSPLSLNERLFERVILQSGVPVGDWVIDHSPLNSTLRLAEVTSCVYPSISDIIPCLQKVPSDMLLRSALSIPVRWRPSLDGYLIHTQPLEAAQEKNYHPVDVLLGINSDEGSLCTIALNAMNSPFYPKILKRQLTSVDFMDLVKSNLLETYKTQDYFLTKITVHEYTSEMKREAELREMLVKFCGDLYVTSHVQKLADVLASRENEQKVYMYEFDHRPSFSIHPSFINAAHGDDVLFTLGLPFQLSDIPEEEVKLTRRSVEAVSNFARRGNPNAMNRTEVWPEYTIGHRQLMTFTAFREGNPVRRSSHDSAVSFWHDIFPTAQHHSCPVSRTHTSIAFGRQEEAISGTEAPKAYFLGTYVSLASSEYLLLGLFCLTVFLFVLGVVSAFIIIKSKRYAAFHRLR